MSNNLLEQLAECLDGKIEEIGILPDGSGFGVLSIPLPNDHWLYLKPDNGYVDNPPMPMKMGENHPDRKKMEGMLREAGRYALRASTSCGKDMDFDPDAVIQNLIVGMLGYHTIDGLSHMDE